MGEVSIDLKAKDQMSGVLDHVTQRLGIFSKAGIGMGIAFAGINIAVGALQQAFSAVVQYIQDGVEANRRFEMSLARLSVSTTDFDVSMGSLKGTLKNFSVMFAEDLNTLADGLRTFIEEGFTASESVNLLWHAERLAIASGNDLASTQEVLHRAFKMFNLGASDAYDVTKKLNGIMSITGMTLGEIDIVLGRVAIAAQKSGISFSDLINLMYTLHETGTSNRMLASELTQQLEDLSKVTIQPMPDSTATSIDTKFKKIAGTVQFTVDQMKQLATISQMDLTGGLDLGAMFSKQRIDEAQGYFNTLNTKGITTLKQFNEEAGRMALNKLNPDFGIMGVDVKLLQLLRTFYQYNDMLAANTQETDTAASRLKAWCAGLVVIKNEVDRLKGVLAENNVILAQAQQELGDLTTQRSYTVAMRTATLAVEAQQDAIQKLQRISDAYSLSQMKNSLEILKIQYSAMGERHGLSREQKNQLAALEKLNAGLQIQEQENQIAIGDIQQNGMQTAQDNLDAIRREHNAVMYAMEIRDLDANIKAKNLLIESTLATIATTNDAITIQMDKWRDNELIKQIAWSLKMHKALVFSYSTTSEAQSSSEQSGTQETVPNPPGWLSKTPFWKYQQGGLVQETAPAMVHKGEFIIPKELVDTFLKKPREMPHINITDIMSREKSDVKRPEIKPIKIEMPDINMPDVKPRERETPRFNIPDIKPREMPHLTMPDLRESGSPIIRSNPVERSLNQTVSIIVHADLHKDIDVEEWGKKLGAGLSSGFLENTSSGTTTATSRKTGATIVVPGTSITTALGLRTDRAGAGVVTLPVAQPIKNKGRFRVG